MFAASRPDESISGDVGRKKKEEEEKKTELSGGWFSGRIKTPFGGDARKSGKICCVISSFFFFRCWVFQNIFEFGTK